LRHILLCLSFRVRPHPRSTLFPYTTLFRSENETFYGARDPFGIKPMFYYETDEGAAFASEKKSIACMLENEEVSEEALQHYLSLDRKSTRLNSSHVSISYAVFCLKKKNTNI